jgi:hypothetical protein
MFGKNDVADKALLKSVQRRLERTGMQSKLNATMRQGTVTLTGKLQYEKQRLQIVNAIKGVSGVRQVVDQLQSPPKVKPQPANQAGAIRVPAQNEQAVTKEPIIEEPNDQASDGRDEIAAEASIDGMVQVGVDESDETVLDE